MNAGCTKAQLGEPAHFTEQARTIPIGPKASNTRLNTAPALRNKPGFVILQTAKNIELIQLGSQEIRKKKKRNFALAITVNSDIRI